MSFSWDIKSRLQMEAAFLDKKSDRGIVSQIKSMLLENTKSEKCYTCVRQLSCTVIVLQ